MQCQDELSTLSELQDSNLSVSDSVTIICCSFTSYTSIKERFMHDCVIPQQNGLCERVMDRQNPPGAGG